MDSQLSFPVNETNKRLFHVLFLFDIYSAFIKSNISWERLISWHKLVIMDLPLEITNWEGNFCEVIVHSSTIITSSINKVFFFFKGGKELRFSLGSIFCRSLSLHSENTNICPELVWRSRACSPDEVKTRCLSPHGPDERGMERCEEPLAPNSVCFSSPHMARWLKYQYTLTLHSPICVSIKHWRWACSTVRRRKHTPDTGCSYSCFLKEISHVLFVL